MDLKEKIRVFPGFKGVDFIDITTLMQDGAAYREAIDGLVKSVIPMRIDVVAAPEARGFLVGAAIAYALGVGLVLVRKSGKLPAAKISHEYALEYGTDILEVHSDSIHPGKRVLIVDDLLATGGTAQAVVKLVQELGGEVAGLAFLIELTFLGGRTKIKDYDVVSLIDY